MQALEKQVKLTMLTKKAMRSTLLEKRQSMSYDEVYSFSQRIAKQVQRLGQWQTAKQVAIYWPHLNEVDTRVLIHELWEQGRQVFLPRCISGQSGSMELVSVHSEHDLHKGAYSIMEPVDSCEILDIEKKQPDLLIIPGLAFDMQGFRLGYGGGYYDRLLEKPSMSQVFSIGLCYARLFMQKLPQEAWDRPVNAVCTEEQTWFK